MDEIARSELIVGGQRSGKSNRAEWLSSQWLVDDSHRAVMIATACAWDEEMRDRIIRHQSDRALRLPNMHTVEEPVNIVSAIKLHSTEKTLIVVDCLTLWLTNLLMPVKMEDAVSEDEVVAAVEALSLSIEQAHGPVVFVSNEIGLGVIPMGVGVRSFVDNQGRLNQHLARVCERVTLMVAGLPLRLK
jgi:adenosylcobinamide kinase/adenosylcobinamide-phosphate guanylyltransferase